MRLHFHRVSVHPPPPPPFARSRAVAATRLRKGEEEVVLIHRPLCGEGVPRPEVRLWLEPLRNGPGKAAPVSGNDKSGVRNPHWLLELVQFEPHGPVNPWGFRHDATDRMLRD